VLAGVLIPLAALASLLLPVAPAAAAPEAGQYVPVPPVTVVDNLSLAAGATTTITVTGVGEVPAAASVSAVALNVVANQPAASGHLQLFPAGATRPVDSTLNYQQGRTTAGFEVVPVSPSGQISIVASGATKLLVRLRGWYTSAAATVTGARFVPVPPSTVVNNLSLAAGGTTTFTATGASGANGIPASSNVKALALNVIANQPTGSGHLQVFPAGSARQVDSTLNYQQGRTTANFEVVPVSGAGQVSVYSTTATKVLVRVRGYYTTSPYTDDGGTYTPVDPATVVNNLSLPAGGTTSIRVTGDRGIPAPAEVSAVALNVIANQPGGSGWLQVYPSAGAQPVNSTLNFQQGQTTANFEVVPVAADGRISIYSTAATKVLVRLRGWYSVAPAPSGADWPQEGNGPARPGANSSETTLDAGTVRGLGQAWAAAVGQTQAAPAVAGEVVYVGSVDGKVRALDAATGATRWTASSGGAVLSSPAVAGGLVYAGSGDRKLYALDADTGATVWTVTTGGAVSAAPAVAGGVVYVGSADRKLYALDAGTGASRWTATTGGPVLDPPAVAGGVVYLRSRDGNAYAFDAASGAPAWTTPVGGNPMFGIGPSVTGPVVAGGRVFVGGNRDGKLYALDATSGAVLWTLSPGDFLVGNPAVADGRLFVNLAGHHLRALDPATGATVWSVDGNQTAPVSSTAPVVANGVLYHGTNGGALLARDPATGTVLWSDTTALGRSTSTYNAVVVANGAVYGSRTTGVTAHHP
jgi:outer membrane protein assembly factor BamB